LTCSGTGEISAVSFHPSFLILENLRRLMRSPCNMSVYPSVFPCLTRRVRPPRSMSVYPSVYPCLTRLMRSTCCPPPPPCLNRLADSVSPMWMLGKRLPVCLCPHTNSFVSYAVRVVSNAGDLSFPELFVVFVIFVLHVHIIRHISSRKCTNPQRLLFPFHRDELSNSLSYPFLVTSL
jgi:hypothetical protein